MPTKDLPLEKDIEAKVVKYAKERGCLARKMNGLGNTSWPDRLFVLPNGRFVWVEFKRPVVGKLSPGQEDLIAELQARSQVVYIVDDVDHGKAIIEAELGRRA